MSSRSRSVGPGAWMAAIVLSVALCGAWGTARASGQAPVSGEQAPVEVFDVKHAKPVLCPTDVTPVGKIRVVGRCGLEEAAQGVDVTVLTAFGEIKLATCWFYMADTVYRDGTVVSSRFSHLGEGCEDIEPCSGDRYQPSIHGQLYLDGRGRVHRRLPMCIETLLGRFEGDLDLALHLERGEWWTHDIRMPVGLSGFAFNGRWRLKRNIHTRPVVTDKGVNLSVRPAR